eukprot:248530-Rhodomonas_salina.1
MSNPRDPRSSQIPHVLYAGERISLDVNVTPTTSPRAAQQMLNAHYGAEQQKRTNSPLIPFSPAPSSRPPSFLTQSFLVPTSPTSPSSARSPPVPAPSSSLSALLASRSPNYPLTCLPANITSPFQLPPSSLSTPPPESIASAPSSSNKQHTPGQLLHLPTCAVGDARSNIVYGVRQGHRPVCRISAEGKDEREG